MDRLIKEMERKQEMEMIRRCDPNLKPFYVSLVHGLIGYCMIVMAEDEMQVRQYCAQYLGRMWCSVYTEPGNMTVIGHAEHWGGDD